MNTQTQLADVWEGPLSSVMKHGRGLITELRTWSWSRTALSQDVETPPFPVHKRRPWVKVTDF